MDLNRVSAQALQRLQSRSRGCVWGGGLHALLDQRILWEVHTAVEIHFLVAMQLKAQRRCSLMLELS